MAHDPANKLFMFKLGLSLFLRAEVESESSGEVRGKVLFSNGIDKLQSCEIRPCNGINSNDCVTCSFRKIEVR